MPLRSRLFILSITVLLVCTTAHGQNVYKDSRIPLDKRVSALLGELTTTEKISLLGYNSPGVARLGIPAYIWWNEALHGVARAGEATIFPQAIGMAATFNDSLIHRVADVISTEARAKFNLGTQSGRRLPYMGLTFWAPNINIFRDPRWGRGQETYGEDPYLTSRMGVAYIGGIQGNNPHYLKASACAKHFAVHSGPEAGRHAFNAVVDEKDLRETYLYAFHNLVDAGLESVMCAYNRVNNEPCCTGNTLLQSILRNEWKFKGHVVTDCGALDDIFLRHKVMSDGVTVAAAAVKAGVNIDCSNILQKDLEQALERKLITVQDIDAALAPALRTQFKLGFFEEGGAVPFDKITAEAIRAQDNVELARLAAQQSIVLLKNDKQLLPLQKEKYGTMLVTGTNATSVDALVGNYHGLSPDLVTFAEGITKAAGPDTGVQYDMGSDYADTVRFGGLWASENSDVTIAVIGLTPVLEGEEGDAFLAAHGGDRQDLSIPAAHVAFMRALRNRHQKPIVAVITAGSAVDVSSIEPYADAILLAWYPGEQGGNALADVLFGNASPGGRLPVTFYQSLKDLPSYDNYAMQGRTYRYFAGKVQYPFGYGLTYTTFDYQMVNAPKKSYTVKDNLAVTLAVKNTGKLAGDEVVQAYIVYPQGERMPLKELKAFKRVHLAAGQQKNVSLTIPMTDLQKWNMKKHGWELTKGEYKIYLGSHSQDQKLISSFKVP